MWRVVHTSAVATLRMLAAIGVLLSLAATVEARPCSPVTAGRAFEEASLIVKGSLVSTTPSKLPDGDSTSLIRIDRIVKGWTIRSTVSVEHFLCGIEYEQAFKPGRPILVFIDASGHLVHGTAILPASSQSRWPAFFAKSALRDELLLASEDPDPITARAGVGALAELDGLASRATLVDASKRDDFGVRVRALSWLTRFSDANAFAELAGCPASCPSGNYCGARCWSRSNLRAAEMSRHLSGRDRTSRCARHPMTD